MVMKTGHQGHPGLGPRLITSRVTLLRIIISQQFLGDKMLMLCEENIYIGKIFYLDCVEKLCLVVCVKNTKIFQSALVDMIK